MMLLAGWCSGSMIASHVEGSGLQLAWANWLVTKLWFGIASAGNVHSLAHRNLTPTLV